jgi:hypothetical protein
LYKNVQEVSPPNDLNLSDPNLINLNQEQPQENNQVYYKPVEQVTVQENTKIIVLVKFHQLIKSDSFVNGSAKTLY